MAWEGGGRRRVRGRGGGGQASGGNPETQRSIENRKETTGGREWKRRQLRAGAPRPSPRRPSGSSLGTEAAGLARTSWTANRALELSNDLRAVLCALPGRDPPPRRRPSLARGRPEAPPRNAWAGGRERPWNSPARPSGVDASSAALAANRGQSRRAPAPANYSEPGVGDERQLEEGYSAALRGRLANLRRGRVILKEIQPVRRRVVEGSVVRGGRARRPAPPVGTAMSSGSLVAK